MKPVLSILLLVCPLAAQQWYSTGDGAGRAAELEVTRAIARPTSVRQPPVENPHGRLFNSSVATLAAANALDMASSWGRPELNPVLSPGGSGQPFGWQAAAIKLGVSTATVLFQRHVLRRRPELARPFAMTNFAMSGLISAVAVRNYRVGAPRVP